MSVLRTESDSIDDLLGDTDQFEFKWEDEELDEDALLGVSDTEEEVLSSTKIEETIPKSTSEVKNSISLDTHRLSNESNKDVHLSSKENELENELTDDFDILNVDVDGDLDSLDPEASLEVKKQKTVYEVIPKKRNLKKIVPVNTIPERPQKIRLIRRQLVQVPEQSKNLSISDKSVQGNDLEKSVNEESDILADSESDEDDKPRGRFKSERNDSTVISLTTVKKRSNIPDTLEISKEDQLQINQYFNIKTRQSQPQGGKVKGNNHWKLQGRKFPMQTTRHQNPHQQHHQTQQHHQAQQHHQTPQHHQVSHHQSSHHQVPHQAPQHQKAPQHHQQSQQYQHASQYQQTLQTQQSPQLQQTLPHQNQHPHQHHQPPQQQYQTQQSGHHVSQQSHLSQPHPSQQNQPLPVITQHGLVPSRSATVVPSQDGHSNHSSAQNVLNPVPPQGSRKILINPHFKGIVQTQPEIAQIWNSSQPVHIESNYSQTTNPPPTQWHDSVQHNQQWHDPTPLHSGQDVRNHSQYQDPVRTAVSWNENQVRSSDTSSFHYDQSRPTEFQDPQYYRHTQTQGFEQQPSFHQPPPPQSFSTSVPPPPTSFNQTRLPPPNYQVPPRESHNYPPAPTVYHPPPPPSNNPPTVPPVPQSLPPTDFRVPDTRVPPPNHPSFNNSPTTYAPQQPPPPTYPSNPPVTSVPNVASHNYQGPQSHLNQENRGGLHMGGPNAVSHIGPPASHPVVPPGNSLVQGPPHQPPISVPRHQGPSIPPVNPSLQHFNVTQGGPISPNIVPLRMDQQHGSVPSQFNIHPQQSQPQFQQHQQAPNFRPPNMHRNPQFAQKTSQYIPQPRGIQLHQQGKRFSYLKSLPSHFKNKYKMYDNREKFQFNNQLLNAKKVTKRLFSSEGVPNHSPIKRIKVLGNIKNNLHKNTMASNQQLLIKQQMHLDEYDEETQELYRKIEEQKKLREDIIRQKELRRQMMVMKRQAEMKNQQKLDVNTNNTIIKPNNNTELIQKLNLMPNPKFSESVPAQQKPTMIKKVVQQDGKVVKVISLQTTMKALQNSPVMQTGQKIMNNKGVRQISKTGQMPIKVIQGQNPNGAVQQNLFLSQNSIPVQTQRHVVSQTFQRPHRPIKQNVIRLVAPGQRIPQPRFSNQVPRFVLKSPNSNQSVQRFVNPAQFQQQRKRHILQTPVIREIGQLNQYRQPTVVRHSGRFNHPQQLTAVQQTGKLNQNQQSALKQTSQVRQNSIVVRQTGQNQQSPIVKQMGQLGQNQHSTIVKQTGQFSHNQQSTAVKQTGLSDQNQQSALRTVVLSTPPIIKQNKGPSEVSNRTVLQSQPKPNQNLSVADTVTTGRTVQKLTAGPVPHTSMVCIANLSASTSEQQLNKLCNTIGPIEKIEFVKNERKAIVKFKNAVHAGLFQKKYSRYMMDLSMLNVSLLST